MLHLLFAITFVFGPAAAASYALANGISPFMTVVTVTFFHIILVPVWFGIFRFLRYESLRFMRIVGQKWERRLQRTIEKKFEEFEKKLRGWSFGVAVFCFTLLFGVSWAALLASILNIRVSAIFPAVTAGAVVSSIFWSLALSGLIGFLPDPTLIYLISLLIATLFAVHGKLGEKKLIRELGRSLKVIRRARFSAR